MNKTTGIVISILCLFSACSEKLICPAYQSSFILDSKYRDRVFSPFEVVNGDTVPKGGFGLQRNRSEFILAKAWMRPERPVLENPYLIARIFNKRPYWKLDVIEPEVIFYMNTDTIRYNNEVIIDSVKTDLPVEYVLTLPVRRPPHNIEQKNYNKKFGHLFPQPKILMEKDSIDEGLESFMADTLAIDSIPEKKGLFNLFKKKKNGEPKPKKEKSGKKNITEGIKEEDLD
jgi:hypothetical protein